MAVTSSDSTRIRGLYTWTRGSKRRPLQRAPGGSQGADGTKPSASPTFCLAKPGSITNTTPSMVREVSAMLVDTTTWGGVERQRLLNYMSGMFDKKRDAEQH